MDRRSQSKSIRYKLSMVFCSFCNNVLHAPAEPLLLAQHHRLNQDIENEFVDGTADLRLKVDSKKTPEMRCPHQATEEYELETNK